MRKKNVNMVSLPEILKRSILKREFGKRNTQSNRSMKIFTSSPKKTPKLKQTKKPTTSPSTGKTAGLNHMGRLHGKDF